MSRRWFGIRSLASLAGGLVIALVLLMVGRSLVESALVRLDESRPVHRDRSVFASGVERSPARRFTLRFDDADGRARSVGTVRRWDGWRDEWDPRLPGAAAFTAAC